MKAALLSVANEPVRVADVPKPQPAQGERLIKIRACGLCGTDVKLRAGKIPGVKHPLILVGSSRVDLQACKLEYSIVSPK